MWLKKEVPDFDLTEAIRWDAILLKFSGDKAVGIQSAKGGEFWPDIAPYFDCENGIKRLLADGLIREAINPMHEEIWQITDKGWSVMSKIEGRGYVAQHNRITKANTRQAVIFWVGMLTFIIVVITFCLDLRNCSTQKTPTPKQIGSPKNTTPSRHVKPDSVVKNSPIKKDSARPAPKPKKQPARISG